MELVSAETIAAIQNALAPVAEKIGQGATFAWDVVVQQQIVYAWLGVFWAVIGLIGLIGMVFAWKAAIKYERSERYSDGAAYIVAGFFTLPFLFSFVAGSITAITHFLNPNYYALQFFIRLGQSAL